MKTSVKVRVFKRDEDGQWTWRLKAQNGQIHASTAQGFPKRARARISALAAIRAFRGDITIQLENKDGVHQKDLDIDVLADEGIFFEE